MMMMMIMMMMNWKIIEIIEMEIYLLFIWLEMAWLGRIYWLEGWQRQCVHSSQHEKEKANLYLPFDACPATL